MTACCPRSWPRSNVAVVAAEDGDRVEPNKVYVIPPNSDLAILDGVLHVMTPPRSTTALVPACRSTILPLARRRSRARGRSASCCRGPDRTGRSACGRSRRRAASRSRRSRPARSTTACRATRSRAAGPISACPCGRSPRSWCGSASTRIWRAPSAPTPRMQEDMGKLDRSHPHRVRQRSQLLQGRHDRAPHRAPHGAAQDREAARLHEVRAEQRRTSCASCTRTC